MQRKSCLDYDNHHGGQKGLKSEIKTFRCFAEAAWFSSIWAKPLSVLHNKEEKVVFSD